ncbi:adenosylcobinamide amidohydrolase [Bosea sp. 117]|uniref:adenosylcobinamide amidohydrolase n=1 Tax=Bosea sp. 117 TaxID=1125973 RepID=UPI0018CC03B4|nr:adenosylcobinamide amidohydrolase [Bosea sp. 117]
MRVASGSMAIPAENRPLEIDCRRPWLVARLPGPHRMVSWSLNRPGFVAAERVAWREVRDADLAPGVDPAAWFVAELAREGLADAVGMMTARDVGSFERRAAHAGAAGAECVVTLGLNNGERVGARLAGEKAFAGTVNILCRASVPLTDAALLEAASLVAQARTVAILEAGHRRPGMVEPVTGTGTDCIIMAAPAGGPAEPYAGMHTAIGEAVGACVLGATRAALAEWIARRG